MWKILSHSSSLPFSIGFAMTFNTSRKWTRVGIERKSIAFSGKCWQNLLHSWALRFVWKEFCITAYGSGDNGLRDGFLDGVYLAFSLSFVCWLHLLIRWKYKYCKSLRWVSSKLGVSGLEQIILLKNVILRSNLCLQLKSLGVMLALRGLVLLKPDFWNLNIPTKTEQYLHLLPTHGRNHGIWSFDVRKKKYLPDESWPEVFVYFLQPFFVLSSLNIVLISALNPQKCYTVGSVCACQWWHIVGQFSTRWCCFLLSEPCLSLIRYTTPLLTLAGTNGRCF